jgi:hypothetical protein
MIGQKAHPKVHPKRQVPLRAPSQPNQTAHPKVHPKRQVTFQSPSQLNQKLSIFV